MAAAAQPRHGTVRFLHTWLEEQRRSAFIDACILDARRVDDAIRRLESGTFGNCVVCAEPIDRDLLADQPWAKRCGSCREPAPVIPFSRRRSQVQADPPTAA
jgi:hypothetical protein